MPKYRCAACDLPVKTRLPGAGAPPRPIIHLTLSGEECPGWTRDAILASEADAPRFRQVKTEYASGNLNGADYGSQVRILMRSETMLVYVASGVHISPRGERVGFHHVKPVASAAKAEMLSKPQARETLVKAFGEGADEQALIALKTRGKGTILVDGGGPAMPLPHAIQAKISSARYTTVSPTTTVVTPDKLCLQCEAPLQPHTVRHHLATVPTADHPRTVEDCQRLTNMPVYSVLGYGSNSPEEWWPIISSFTTWDGESYVDIDFCSDRCAAVYGRRAAAELPHLPPGRPTTIRPRHSFESVKHYEEEVRVTKSGLRY